MDEVEVVPIRDPIERSPLWRDLCGAAGVIKIGMITLFLLNTVIIFSNKVKVCLCSVQCHHQTQ